MNKDHAYASILGALIGDAIGAPQEFTGREINIDAIKSALLLEGGGPLGTAPGQFTDDGEMQMALQTALSTTSPSAGFPADAVATAYQNWYKSHPIDAGFTCKTACVLSKDGDADSMRNTAAQYSMQSKANGNLMKVMPIPIWCHRLPDDKIVGAAIADCRLTHPNPTCQHAAAAYCLALAHLINNVGDSAGSINKAQQYCAKSANAEVRNWLYCALTATKMQSACDQTIGYVKWAFTYAFFHLKHRTPYLKAMFEVLLLKGDTDTNLAIVGGLIGALHGFDGNGVPRWAVDKLLKGQPRGQRPKWLSNSAVPDTFERLWAAANS